MNISVELTNTQIAIVLAHANRNNLSFDSALIDIVECHMQPVEKPVPVVQEVKTAAKTPQRTERPKVRAKDLYDVASRWAVGEEFLLIEVVNKLPTILHVQVTTNHFNSWLSCFNDWAKANPHMSVSDADTLSKVRYMRVS